MSGKAHIGRGSVGSRLWHGAFEGCAEPAARPPLPRIRLPRAQSNRKRPGGEPRRVLGLLQGGEICISIYVDPWEVGGPFDESRAARRGKR